MAAMPYPAQIRTSGHQSRRAVRRETWPDGGDPMTEGGPTVYDAAGGMEFFERLVGDFYAGVAGDDVLAPLYPEAPDFSGAQRRLTLFLAQYCGGPGTYSEQRGHPPLRTRHFPVPT